MYENIKNYISLKDCKDGYTYLILARNGSVGIFNQKESSFILSRHKFGDNFLFEEDHWDADGSGTAKPIKEISKEHIEYGKMNDDETLKYLNALSELYEKEYESLINKEDDG